MRSYKSAHSARPQSRNKATTAPRALPRVALAATVLLAAALALVAPAPAAARAATDDNTVAGVSPRGTTINLFDYWLTAQDAADDANPADYKNLGINADHVLKFGKGMGQVSATAPLNDTSVNDWTMSSQPRTGIVERTLAANDYPTLSSALGGGSLAYLFSPASGEGKAAYANVRGLLQVDDQGYYYYSSQKNFAQFNEATNDFTLYSTWGVKKGGSSPNGQFFPFNTASQVFTQKDGALVQSDVSSTSPVINHYFGLTMATRFVQQYGGRTAPEDVQGSQPVTYNFSGDDDVWIFIDDVLVGDLGGIHNATSIQIDFSTGEVVVYGDSNNDNVFNDGDTPYQQTTLRELFQAAGKANVTWNGDTFSDSTYHTLNFFYLERGNTDSNMSLRYNLVNIPESGIVKVDQLGSPLAGVEYQLFPADEDYAVTSDAYYTGTTDANGSLTFTTTEGSGTGDPIPVTLGRLNEISDRWVLRESKAPEGYRSPSEMHLRFQDGALLSTNIWETGAYSQPHVAATATDVVYPYDDLSAPGYSADDGVMFAVVLQRQDDGTWAPVSGDAFSGWTVGESVGADPTSVTDSVIAAAQADRYQFLVSSGGAYQVSIENLPGDFSSYEYVLESNGGDPADAKYCIGYYRTSTDSLDGATPDNTVRLQANAVEGEYEGFDRMFSVTLSIPNIKNGFTVVKTNAQTGEPMEGVEFTLYEDANANGTLDDGEKSVFSGFTDTKGALAVPGSEGVLNEGRYLLVETVPEGFAGATGPIQVAVDGEGVHVDAGTEKDNVSVEQRIGALVYSMRSFAADDKIDSTLHEVKAQPQVASGYDGDQTAWKDADSPELHFSYRDEGDQQSLTYQPSNGSAASFVAQSGWSRLEVTQCLDPEHESENGTEYKQDLGDQSLNAVFTGNVIVHVENEPATTPPAPSPVTVSGISANKQLTGRDLKTNDFEFLLSRVDGSEASRAWNAADGTVTFGTLTYVSPGVYKYAISEVAGDAEGVTYDASVYDVTVTVTEDGDGGLVASVAYETKDGKPPTFVNEYVEKDEPSTPTDPTDPGEPIVPTEPEEPSGPEDPGTAADETPEQPSRPSTPEEPNGTMPYTGERRAIVVASVVVLGAFSVACALMAKRLGGGRRG